VNKLALLFPAAALIAGCAAFPSSGPMPSDYHRADMPAQYATALPGTVYRDGVGLNLFMDIRARGVGDILTVRLVERTNASKESSTSAARASDVNTGLPTIAGRPITLNGNPILNAEFGAETSFNGQADASQSNSLDGNIAVTVVERLPNGNLLVRGEKWITLNQGEEYIQVQGVVRPVDIGPNNTIASTKIADARITYSGKGTLADSNRRGWLAKFFDSPWFPF
jgi:flagellar L-ring protein precursor FlgH